MSNATGVFYQWIDCATGWGINGETNQTYDVTTNGEYAVIVDNGGWIDTSECFLYDNIGLAELPTITTIIHPNPVSTVE